MVDDVARPTVRDDEFELGECLEHLARKSRALLGDHEDVVVNERLDKQVRIDCLAIKRNLSVTERRPIAELLGDADVVV